MRPHKKVEQLLLQKEITLACVAYATGKQNPDLEYRDFGAEYLVLALPASHPLAHLAGEESWKTLPWIWTYPCCVRITLCSPPVTP